MDDFIKISPAKRAFEWNITTTAVSCKIDHPASFFEINFCNSAEFSQANVPNHSIIKRPLCNFTRSRVGKLGYSRAVDSVNGDTGTTPNLALHPTNTACARACDTTRIRPHSHTRARALSLASFRSDRGEGRRICFLLEYIRVSVKFGLLPLLLLLARNGFSSSSSSHSRTLRHVSNVSLSLYTYVCVVYRYTTARGDDSGAVKSISNLSRCQCQRCRGWYACTAALAAGSFRKLVKMYIRARSSPPNGKWTSSDILLLALYVLSSLSLSLFLCL